MQSSIVEDGAWKNLRQNVMSAKSSLLLFAAGWILLAIATLPAQASGAPVPVSVTTPTAVTGTFPLVNDQIPPGQVHLLRLSAREDAGMQATITYLDSVNGSTGTLSPIHGDFVNCQENISRSITSADIRDSAADLRGITELFRGETDALLQEPCRHSGRRPVLGIQHAPWYPGLACRAVWQYYHAITGERVRNYLSTEEPYGDHH